MANLSNKHFTLGVLKKNIWWLTQSRASLKSHEQKIVSEGQKIIKDKVKAEMHQAVVEVGTDICHNIEEAHKDVATLRKTISDRLRCGLRLLDGRIRHASFQPLGKPVNYRSFSLQSNCK